MLVQRPPRTPVEPNVHNCSAADAALQLFEPGNAFRVAMLGRSGVE